MLLVGAVETVAVSIIGRLEREDDDFCQFLFPSELINRAFEVIRPASWQGVLPDLLVVFAAVAWLDSLFARECFHRSINVAGGAGGNGSDFLVVFAAMAALNSLFA
ncbi:hypothetical protein RND71_009294 [Anisodus tanguticus]|uniref:Uncharacterized protein n=1 Tax=Anisodus tanguticus TaxID=243964 RepID=A0AAE1VR01_9SOLA|nr:hypothetical protein RND71_009294 [Anisodus tanguticus]